MHKLLVLPALALALAFSSTASADNGWEWNKAAAEASLKKDYRTVDPWALQDLQPPAGILGVPKPNPRLVALAKRAAFPTWAFCLGRGPHPNGMYARFWCMVDFESLLSDYQATKSITLIPTGRYSFRVLSGNH